jgi:hypothetical protein
MRFWLLRRNCIFALHPPRLFLLQRCNTTELAVPGIEAFAHANLIHRLAPLGLALPCGCCFVQSQHEVKVSCSQFAGRVERIPETAELLSEVTRDCWAGSCASTVA